MIDQLLDKDRSLVIPSGMNDQSLTEKFSEFFLAKIGKLRATLDAHMANDHHHEDNHCRSTFDCFCTVARMKFRSLS